MREPLQKVSAVPTQSCMTLVSLQFIVSIQEARKCRDKDVPWQAWKWKRAYRLHPSAIKHSRAGKFFCICNIYVFWWDSPASSRYPKMSVFWRWKRQNMYTLGRFRYESRPFQEVTGVICIDIYIDISQVSSCKFPFKKLWWGHFLALKNQGSPQEKVVSSPFMTTFYYIFIYFPGPLGITAGISITFTLSPTWRVKFTARLAGSKDIEVEEPAAFGFRFEDFGGWRWLEMGGLLVRWAGWWWDGRVGWWFRNLYNKLKDVTVTVAKSASLFQLKTRSSKTQLSFKNP